MLKETSTSTKYYTQQISHGLIKNIYFIKIKAESIKTEPVFGVKMKLRMKDFMNCLKEVIN